MLTLFNKKVKLLGGEIKQFGDNDYRTFDKNRHRWVALTDKYGKKLSIGDIIRHHYVGSKKYRIIDDDSYFHDIDTGEYKPAVLVVDDDEGGKERILLHDEVSQFYVKVPQEGLVKGFVSKLLKAFGVQLNLFGGEDGGSSLGDKQLSLFEGQTKQFGANDTRVLKRTKKGVRRWVSADDKPKESNKKKVPDKSQEPNINQLALDFDKDPAQLNLLSDKPNKATKEINQEPPKVDENENLSLDERVQKYLDEKQKNREYKDYGERVRGSKKEIAALKKMTAQEMIENNVDIPSIYKVLTKDKVYKPDWRKLKEEGKPASVVYVLKGLYDAIANRPKPKKHELTELVPEYIETLPKIFEYLEQANNVYELKKRVHNLFHINKYLPRSRFTVYWENSVPFKVNKKLDLVEVFGLRFFELNKNDYNKVWGEASFKDAMTVEQHQKQYERDVLLPLKWARESTEKILNNPEKLEEILAEHGKRYGITDLGWADIHILQVTQPEEYNKLIEKLKQYLIQAAEKRNISYEEWSVKNPRRVDDWSFLDEDADNEDENKDTEDADNEDENKDNNEKQDEGNDDKGTDTGENKGKKKKTEIHHKPLFYIHRVNGREVKEEDITPEQIAKEFGYKSVQLGHYVKDAEARDHIRYFIASMKDLEDALDIDIAALNKEFGLSISFGARGSGSATAHYEPLFKIINVTKNNGDGSVAHEWGHFLDDFIGRKLENKESTPAMASELMQPVVKKFGIYYSKYYSGENLDLSLAVRDVMSNIKIGESYQEIEVKPNTASWYYPAVDSIYYLQSQLQENINQYLNNEMMNEEEKRDLFVRFAHSEYFYRKVLPKILEEEGFKEKALEDELKSYKDDLWKRVDKLKAASEEKRREWFSQYNILEGGLAELEVRHFRKGLISAISDYIKHFSQVPVKVKVPTEQTQFLSGANKRGKYWAKTPELFARAFESYVQDKLEEKKMANNYLVRNNRVTSDAETNDILVDLYPQGKERKEINQAFDKLMNILRKSYPRKNNNDKRVDEDIELKKSVPSKIFGNQISLFEDKPHEGDVKEGANGHRLVLRNHRWHLDDEIRLEEKRRKAQENQYYHSDDPNQLDMFPSDNDNSLNKNKSEAPLKKIKDALAKVKEVKQQDKLKQWNALADDILKEANAQKKVYLSDIDSVARKVGLKPTSAMFDNAAVKSKESLFKEFEQLDAKGEHISMNSLNDILSTTLIIDTPNKLQPIIKELENKGYKVKDIDNLFEKDSAYKHIALKLVKGDSDKLVKELLLIRPNMLQAKQRLGGDLQDIQKNIEAVLPKVDPPLKNILEAYKSKLLHYSSLYYQAANELDEKSQAPFSSSNLEDTNATPPEMQPKRKSSKSKLSLLERRLATELKSDLKATWQPTSAKLKAASEDIPNSGASDSIADLISSIITPVENIYSKYTATEKQSNKKVAQKQGNFAI